MYYGTNPLFLDKNRPRKVVFYGRVSTEHEAQLSALENQMQWYEDTAKRFPNWEVVGRYIDEGITGTQAKKRPSFMKMIADAEKEMFDLIVTREVCRFARNTVDTLTHTRALKGRGIEVFFVDDNIWTMDGDGELRLAIMATLAQEESRKVSERVKAGQRISRANKQLFGSGNILGYDRKPGETYTINPEQAETVRMIYDLYEEGYGTLKIAKILQERKRLTATGTTKWTCHNVGRILQTQLIRDISAITSRTAIITSNRSVFIILIEIPMNMSRVILSRLLPKNSGTDVRLFSKRSVKPHSLRTAKKRKRAIALPETFGSRSYAALVAHLSEKTVIIRIKRVLPRIITSATIR